MPVWWRETLHWLALLGCGVSSAQAISCPIWDLSAPASPVLALSRDSELQSRLRHCALCESGEFGCHGPILKLKINVCSLYSDEQPEFTKFTMCARLLTLGSPLPDRATRSAHSTGAQ